MIVTEHMRAGPRQFLSVRHLAPIHAAGRMQTASISIGMRCPLNKRAYLPAYLAFFQLCTGHRCNRFSDSREPGSDPGSWMTNEHHPPKFAHPIQFHRLLDRRPSGRLSSYFQNISRCAPMGKNSLPRR